MSRGVSQTTDSGDAVHVDLPDDRRAPTAARVAVREALARWRLGAISDDVLLTVSELVTNAVEHGRPPVWLRLRRRPGHLSVSVHDDHHRPPHTAGLASTADESGRGLAIVDALADRVQVEQVPEDGTIVHAEFDAEEGR